jgi:hypothetical protein
MGIEVMGVIYGEINGERYEPYPEHDHLCRKKDNPMAYTAPVYIIDDGDNVVKLADMGDYKTVDKYVEYIDNVISQIENMEDE